ncbi:hypothetical protein BGW39_001017, partial [Mortierella sp. 14UC]
MPPFEFGSGHAVWKHLATCARSARNQDQARLADLLKLIQEMVSQAAHTHFGNAGCTYSRHIMMLRAGVQALSNLLTGNEASKDYIWNSFRVQ